MRKVPNLFGATAVAASLCLGAMASMARAQDAPAGNAAEGKRIYLATGCFFCHGRSGQGGMLNGPAPIIAKTAMPWEGFVNQLRHPINEMPAYAEMVMPDKQVADIYAFLQSLPGPVPNAKEMPIFKN
jgi:mono/diheme cytochrome c family protein